MNDANAATPDTRRPLSEAMLRGNVFSDRCPSREVLNHLTSRWGVLVLIGLLDGTHRFSALRRKINGVSEKMLAQTLQSLEADGFVERIAHPVVPPHVEYSLTPLGREAGQMVERLANWVELHFPAIAAARERYDATTESA
jgi:DNA-binding HxlR family transcriptional regulator